METSEICLIQFKTLVWKYRIVPSQPFYFFQRRSSIDYLPAKTPGWRLWLPFKWRDGTEPFWFWYFSGGLGLTTIVPELSPGLESPILLCPPIVPEFISPGCRLEIVVSSQERLFNFDWRWPCWSLDEEASKIMNKLV